MQLTKLTVCLLAVVTKIRVGGLIVKTSESDESVVEATIDILESCYEDRIGTVGLAGVSIGSIVRSISLRGAVIPVTMMIDETSSAANDGPVDRGSRHKLQIFVISAIDPLAVGKTLVRIRNSKWWNHMASFLLINLSLGEKSGCSNARETLWEAWKMNLLNSKFLCYHRTRGILIYTFNPYTGEAPVGWEKQNTYKGMNDHVWTLFAREYREDDSHCDALDFDKTLDLGGYEIRASVEGMDKWWYADPNVKPSIGNRARNATAQFLMNSVNATWKLVLHTGEGTLKQSKNGDPLGTAREVINGSTDICLNLILYHGWVKYESTYPHHTAAVAVITQYRGHRSQLDKLVSVLDKSSRFCVLVVLSITLLFFKFYMRQPLIPAILNLVLIICNAAILRLPKNVVPRIYLGSLLVVAVTIQGIYQGQLATLLTKQVRLPTIDSTDDLARSDHKIYGETAWRSFFNRSTLDGRYVDVFESNCTGYVLRDPKAACMGGNLWLMTEAVNFKLHLSRESMGTVYGSYLVRRDWPLEERVNAIHERARAGDIVRPLYTGDLNDAMRTLESVEDENQGRGPEPLNLRQLAFAFALLAIGLACATVTFVIEVTICGTALTTVWTCARQRITRIA